jgi:hypothetical protein
MYEGERVMVLGVPAEITDDDETVERPSANITVP